ncbi:DUF305 domain-containing protein [Actinotalea fermentans]|uniref:DUF305 domain-containing protein n=1 Tax=Actinotalea fermentans TaxID=43671 RepID=A0A511YUR1_9CELL|nr:DUF305 domain-containing protein [Actinotalea fermentans]KGM17468.1 hypothetical protein N867_02985 [Actinotalea fermentans ATCC 43279 = JCM 9966 = DSM 3133]GEN78927.1 hypothetical protein AFE02nite_06610 [Actinotalea fermentans]
MSARLTGRAATVAAVVVATAAGLAVGLLVAGGVLRADVPVEGSAEVGFARDMQAHHAQAVEMAMLVRDRSDDAELRQVALDIVLTQQQQQGQMYGWLSVWGLPQATTAAPMAWAQGHGHGGAEAGGAEAGGTVGMPGMATAEQLAALRDARGSDAERLFLELMIAHHEGGVAMARSALDLAEHPAVRRLAQAVVDSQTAEIAVLEGLLARVDD